MLLTDQALEKSEKLLEKMMALFEGDDDEDSSNNVAGEHASDCSATPIVCSALEKAELLLKELHEIDGLDDVDLECVSDAHSHFFSSLQV